MDAEDLQEATFLACFLCSLIQENPKAGFAGFETPAVGASGHTGGFWPPSPTPLRLCQLPALLLDLTPLPG